jgi:hypothetical protein
MAQQQTPGNSAIALITELNKFTPNSLNDGQAERYKAIELSKRLTATLEGPVNQATELIFKVQYSNLLLFSLSNVLQPFITIAARIAVGMNLFEPIVARGGKSISSKELAELTGGEEMLICQCYPIINPSRLGIRIWG